jgi:short-subunit dehydrogenase
MIVRRQGRIINVSSAAGLQPIPYASAYVISKTAVIRFTENLANETKEYGISVFTLYPGEVRTAFTNYLIESEEGQKWTPWVRQLFEAKLDVPQEHAAKLAAYLASGKADTLTGCFISVRDNVNIMVQRAEEIKEKQLYTLRLKT